MRAAVVATCCAWLAAAVLVHAAPTAPEIPAALGERATAFMKAWQARDLSAMHAYYCPAFQQQTPRLEFLKLSRLLRFPILEFRLKAVEDLHPTRATLVLSLKSDAAGSPVGIFDSESRQIWLKPGTGSWCKENETPLIPLPGAPRY